MREALLERDGASILAAIEGDGLAPGARLAIYRHHVFATLTAALETTYPAVRHLVDPRFFGYAAHAYIAAQPPAGPCLAEYGATFPGFLAAFPACAHLPWLPDVARLEWAMNAALVAADAATLDPAALGEIGAPAAARLVLRLHPSVTYLESPWAIDRVWRASQPDADPDERVDVAAGPVRLEIRRAGDDVVYRRLDAPAFALRRALGTGRALRDAAAGALGLDPALDLAGALADLLAEDLVVGFEVSEDDGGSA